MHTALRRIKSLLKMGSKGEDLKGQKGLAGTHSRREIEGALGFSQQDKELFRAVI